MRRAAGGVRGVGLGLTTLTGAARQASLFRDVTGSGATALARARELTFSLVIRHGMRQTIGKDRIRHAADQEQEAIAQRCSANWRTQLSNGLSVRKVEVMNIACLDDSLIYEVLKGDR